MEVKSTGMDRQAKDSDVTKVILKIIKQLNCAEKVGVLNCILVPL